ncbi:hypothetical protein B0H11DRAFT_2226426 [Mycena galericulata]|nr:hypothetical protein B0H11DRAFT_2226426 [Mycena galericulata]
MSLVDHYTTVPHANHLPAAVRHFLSHCCIDDLSHEGKGTDFQVVIRFYKLGAADKPPTLCWMSFTVGESSGVGFGGDPLGGVDMLLSLFGFTISSDGTSHRNQEYQGRHVNVKAPNYTDDSPAVPRVRLLSIDSDKTIRFSLVQFFSKLKGMHGDHAADGKKDARILSELKKEFGLLDLGTRQLLASSPEQMEVVIEKANEGKIQDAGGLEAWNALTQEERDKRSIETMNELKVSIGQDVYDSMTGERTAPLRPVALGRLLHAQGLERDERWSRRGKGVVEGESAPSRPCPPGEQGQCRNARRRIGYSCGN